MSGADAPAPFRIQFDNARDPYTARNALGITSTGGGSGAPINAEYITAASDPTLTNERVLTNTATVTWDFTTPGQAKANASGGGGGGGNVSNSGTPVVGQYAKWVTSTTIQGVSPATVLSDIGAQPLDADLTAIAALTGTNTIYFRSASNVWSPVVVSTGLAFSGGNLTCTVSTSGFQPLDTTLTALAAYNTNGLLTQTAPDTFTGRTITGPAAGITVTNGNGVSGNPTLALADDLAALEALTGTNTIYYRSSSSAWTAVVVGTGLSFATGTLDRAALTGDVTASAGSNATTIANDAVTYAKMQNVSAASKLLGRGSASGAGDPEEITLGTNLSMSGTTLNASGGGAGNVTLAVQTFTASGTYTPTAGMRYCTIELVGGGGGGGGCQCPSGMAQGAGAGGAGGYSRKTVAAATIGASQTVTIGTAGTAGTAAGGNGGAGTATSVGTICVANGGAGGLGGTTAATTSLTGGNGGDLTGAVGDVVAAGQPGQSGLWIGSSATVPGGNGGSSCFGGGGRGGAIYNSSAVGGAASSYGSGGGGACNANGSTQRAGGAGSAGFVIITEYL